MSKAVLISIHPKHVTNILSGRKIFEYRKVIPSQEISHLVLYSTAPVMKIVAVAEVVGRIIGPPTKVWNVTGFGSGIPRSFFREYFAGQRQACALSLGRVYELVSPRGLSSLAGVKTPPQSFSYLNDDDIGLILKNRSKSATVGSHMVFVGGIHGVGKSTICSNTFDALGYECVTASSLISAYGGETDNNKRVDHVEENQSLLLDALDKAKSKNGRLLLDGHYTLISGQGDIKPIDIEVFRAMRPNQLILIKGKPDEIAAHLEARDGKIWTESFLSNFQEAEEAHARNVAKSIGVPLRIISNHKEKIRMLID
jgi:adenylate kinase